MPNSNQWRALLVLSALFLAGLLLPSGPIDPWGVFSIKKLVALIFALAFLQWIGAILYRWVGPQAGAVLKGFLGGLVSSTALTADLARQSKEADVPKLSFLQLSLLSATLAMLLQSVVIVFLGLDDLEWHIFLVYLPVSGMTAAWIYLKARRLNTLSVSQEKEFQFDWRSILKLSLFIILILAVSKSAQILLGESGLFVLSFLGSLFELHATTIALVQLFDSGNLTSFDLQILLLISVCASYVSKTFILFTLGSSVFFRWALLWLGLVCVALASSFLLIIFQ